MNSATKTYLQRLQAGLEQRRDPENAPYMERYMRNLFPFYGVKSTDRKEYFQAFQQEHGLPEGEELKALWRACWQSPYREMQYFVNDSGRRAIKKLDPSFLELLEELIVTKSWWDTVDFLAPKLAGHLLLQHPNFLRAVNRQWIESENIWLQRSAILLQLDYKEKTNADLLFDNVVRRSDSKEFFVQKAAGWALRQYSKVAPQQVLEFIQNTSLSSLTEREGLKWLHHKKVI